MPEDFRINSDDVDEINRLLGTSYNQQDFVRFCPQEVRRVIDKLVDVTCTNLSSEHEVLPKGVIADDLAGILRQELIRLYGHADADAPVKGWQVPPGSSS